MADIIAPLPLLSRQGEGVHDFALMSKTVWVYAIDENRSS
jgi:hypothetical protein